MMYFQMTDWMMRAVAQGKTTMARTILRPWNFSLSTRPNMMPRMVDRPTTTMVQITVLSRVFQNVAF